MYLKHDNSLAEVLRCPVCLDLPLTQVFQCQNGHALCQKCSEQVTICPNCRVQLKSPKIRNRVAENILDLLTFNCPFKEFYCSARGTRGEISCHSSNCGFRGTRVNLCKLLGFSCKYIVWERNLLAAWGHFQWAHGPFTRYDSQAYGVAIPNIGSITILQYNYDLQEDHVTLNCVCIKEPADIAEKNGHPLKPTMTLLIKSIDPSYSPDISWSFPAVDLKYARSSLQNSSIRIPYKVLEQYAVNDEITIHFLVS